MTNLTENCKLKRKCCQNMALVHTTCFRKNVIVKITIELARSEISAHVQVADFKLKFIKKVFGIILLLILKKFCDKRKNG